MLTIPSLTFDEAVVRAYGILAQSLGYSRRKLIDRMISAHAISISATLITLNGADFRDVAGVDLLEW